MAFNRRKYIVACQQHEQTAAQIGQENRKVQQVPQMKCVAGARVHRRVAAKATACNELREMEGFAGEFAGKWRQTLNWLLRYLSREAFLSSFSALALSFHNYTS